MSRMTYDVAIVGVGGMGSAAAYHLARRGLRVLAVERYGIAHDHGSSHGLSRIFRLAYFEHPSYVPLLRRALVLWRELQHVAAEPLFTVTGTLDIGAEGGRVFDGALRACLEHELPHEVLDGEALAARVPAWTLPREFRAVWQPDGGFLAPERCIRAHVQAATAHGADVRTRERVRGWRVKDGAATLHTDAGSYDAGQIVVAAGAWNGALASPLAPLLVPERQVVCWFATQDPRAFVPAAFPVFILDAEEGLYYGFPEHGVPGFKIGRYHHRHEATTPETLRRECDPEDEAVLRQAVGRYLPSANGPLLRSSVCLFTNTPDGHFIIDRDPNTPEVLLVSPCSGHGFKFCSVVGEIVAELVVHGKTRHDISLFRLNRFAAAGGNSD